MTKPDTTASSGSVAVAGDNQGSILNVNAADGGTVNVHIESQVARELPSFLSDVIVLFSHQSLSAYGLGPRRDLPPEALLKVKYNNLPLDHPVLVDYRRHGLILERCYQGVEQQNDDARYLVIRKAAFAYKNQLTVACTAASIPTEMHATYARANAASLIAAVIAELIEEYKSSKAIMVAQETAHLAISLVIADAIVECEVLERPSDVATA